MTRNDFLNALYQALLYLSAKERQEIMQDYEEHFDAGQEQGKAEEEICHALGDPEEIAQTYLQQSKAGPGLQPLPAAAPPPPPAPACAAASPSNERVLYTVLFILDLIFFALPGIPSGFALVIAGVVVLIASIAAGIFASSGLLAVFFIALAVALASAGALVILLVAWSLRACYRRMR